METGRDWGGAVTRARRNTLGDVLLRTRSRDPEKLALVYEGERLTYAALDDRVNQTARALAEDGVGKGDRVAVLSRNSMDFAVVNFAVARLGAILVPMNYMLLVDDLAYILHHAGVSVLVAAAEFAPSLDAAARRAGVEIRARYLMDADAPPPEWTRRTADARRAVAETPATNPTPATSPTPGAAASAVGGTADEAVSEREPVLTADWIPLGARRRGVPADLFEAEVDDEDVAHVLYTSGTESRPKGVMLTHRNLISEYVSCIVDGHMEARDVAIHALPLYHSAQLHCFLGPGVYVGGTGIILAQASPHAILETVEREGATQLFCPPTVWIALLRHPDFERKNLTSLEKCYYGAAIMPREVLLELSRKLPQAKFWNFYGQTEVAPLATVLQPEDQLRKLGSAGRPALNVETRIVDDEGNEVPRGTVGEIVHRTAHAMKGYLHDPERTAEAFRGGWFHSGDLGVMDEDGYITVVDRKKDMIKTGGVNVASREVEEVIYQFPGVSEVAVIGVPDPYWIEAVTAVVVPRPGMTVDPAEVITFCRERLAAFKVPKHVVLADALPRNPSGKILKRELRRMYAAVGEAGGV
ncbi:long-chain-fatty-acid--CoA ligase [Alicyclobacillus sp.]|uniref:long-chain-fatty-acid--CoA ligase n=1 Tax=Alicyclobacillus sp. TaxID=61169 RepID=UPI0025C01D36|nr:long-chain-fatty-acid--CoA ligase [Alicyclobacillus sp.]MCL6516917.1 long-chain-fatty-acid--CoA ligase [Alicyclobacillus sp.]